MDLFEIIHECEEDRVKITFVPNENKYILEQKSLIDETIKILNKYLNENNDEH